MEITRAIQLIPRIFGIKSIEASSKLLTVSFYRRCH